MRRRAFMGTAAVGAAWAMTGCPKRGEDEVVVYTALDEMYSRPILDDFSQATGVVVKAAYDSEASKTTGLVTRIISEASRPRADVFWNNEVAQSIALKRKGLLTAYKSPSANAMPANFKDADGYWTGFAARARVIIHNTNLVAKPPTGILDFLKPEWKGKTAIALPLFGTTATHAAALFAAWGPEKASEFFRGLKANSVGVLPGNATVRDMVAKGIYAFGLTDTDDANGAVEDGLPAKWSFPDQGADGFGALLIPNSVAIVARGPNPVAARKLVDYLLSPNVERKLADSRSMQIPLNPAVHLDKKGLDVSSLKAMDVGFEKIADFAESAAEFIRKEFLS